MGVRQTPDEIEALKAATLDDLSGYRDDDWREPPKPKRDWKKVVLIFGLGTLSWVATYIGMLELIQANMGSLSIGTKVVIGFSVAMLMTMIIWLLDQLFAPLPFATKAAYLLGYAFLTTISVGFGFGFYWKVLESRSEATRSAESAVTQVQGSLTAAAARLDQLQTTLAELTAVSSAKAIEERERGTSCPNSRPGDGPRRKLRDDDAARFGYASNFVQGRAQSVKGELKALDGHLKKLSTRDPSTIDPTTGTRNAFLRDLSRKLELTAAGFNAFRTDPQLRQIRSDLDARSSQTIFPSGRGNRTFSCPDPQLQTALRGVVRAIDQLPTLGKPEIATVEGSEAVIEAFRRLTATMAGVIAFKLPPSADELRELQKRAVREAENNGRTPAAVSASQGGLSKRDFVPLAIAIFVDLCLLLVSIGRPMNRIDGLIPRMRSAEQGPVYQILSKFSDIHRDEEIRQKFEIFRHVVFDFNGDYYIAVPLDAPDHRGSAAYEEMAREAHLLANLFASFEKEKIFSRVVNPLLSTRMIQRKLGRQGSKFAESKGFRVYRFRSGAWSEIILGAVMGAAKRAEHERRRQRLAETIAKAASRVDAELQPEPFIRDLPQAPSIAPDMETAEAWTPPSAASTPSSRPHPRRAGVRYRPAPVSIDASLAADAPVTADADKFGPYAQSAADDLAGEAEIEIKPSVVPDGAEVIAFETVREGSLRTLAKTRRTRTRGTRPTGQPAASAEAPGDEPDVIETAAQITTALADHTPPPVPVLPPENPVDDQPLTFERDTGAAVQPTSAVSIASAPAPAVVVPENIDPAADNEETDAVISRFAPDKRPRVEAAE